MIHRVARSRPGAAERHDASVRRDTRARRARARPAARRRAITAVRPSPARVEAPEPDVWIPILDLELLEALGSAIDPVLLRELEGLEHCFREPPVLEPDRSVELLVPGPTPAAGPVPAIEPITVPESTVEPSAAPRPEAVASARIDTAVGSGHDRHRFLHWVTLALALAVVVAGVPYFLQSPAQRRVTLDVDGASFARTTRADDVAGLLTATGVALAPGDHVVPAPDTTLRNGSTVRVVRAVSVTVDVDGAVRAVRTTAKTVKQLRRELEIPPTMVAVGGPGRVHRNDAIVFRTQFDVVLVTDGVAGSLSSTARTVGELLAERGVAFAPGDQIDPPLETPLSSGIAITVTRTTAGRINEDSAAPFDVEERPDPTLAEGTRRVVQRGVDGVDRTTYQLTRDGDAVVAKLALGTVRMRAPQPEIVAVGTQPIGGTGHQTGSATWYATLRQPGTCAHLHLPFGTLVRVTDPASGNSATCRVADRGPEAWTGHIIDLSPDVFEQLQPLSTGEIDVRLDY